MKTKIHQTFLQCPHAKQVVLPLLSVFLLLPITLSAADVVAALKNPSTVIRSDAATGRYLGTISVSKAIAVGCDGETIAVLLANGNINRYDAQTGSYQGCIAVGAKATGVQVSNGVIIAQKDHTIIRYDGKTGRDLCISSL